MSSDVSQTPVRSRWHMPAWLEGMIGQLIALVIAIIGGAIIIVLVGEDPVLVFTTLLRGAFGNSERIAGSLLQATPIIIAGVAACVALRGGLFNIGVEGGQLLVITILGLALGWTRRRHWYRRVVVMPLSLAIAVIGLYWTLTRVATG